MPAGRGLDGAGRGHRHRARRWPAGPPSGYWPRAFRPRHGRRHRRRTRPGAPRRGADGARAGSASTPTGRCTAPIRCLLGKPTGGLMTTDGLFSDEAVWRPILEAGFGAVDMEAAGVAEVCEQRGRRLVGVPGHQRSPRREPRRSGRLRTEQTGRLGRPGGRGQVPGPRSPAGQDAGPPQSLHGAGRQRRGRGRLRGSGAG